MKRAALLLVLSVALTACASWSDATPISRAQAAVADDEKVQRAKDEQTKNDSNPNSLLNLLGFLRHASK